MVDRIRELLTWQQLSPTQFADRIGVGRPVVSHILSERNKPSLEVVQRIIGAFPAVSMPWLLSGTGPMLAAPTQAPLPPATTVAPAAPATPEAAPVATVVAPVATKSASPARKVAPQAGSANPPVTQRFVSPARVATQPGRFIAPAAQVAVAQAATAEAATEAAGRPVVPAPVLPSVAVATPVAPVGAPPTAVADILPAIAAAPATAPLTSSSPGGLLLPGPAKAIRRIVIFYQDGSFADYSPEN